MVVYLWAKRSKRAEIVVRYTPIVLRLTVYLLLITSVDARHLPRFEDYQVRVFDGKTVAPQPPKSQDREVRCCAWFEDLGPINFAGKYRLTLDTCGSECITVHLVDRVSGDHSMEGSYSYSYMFGPCQSSELPHGAEYRANSRLLIVHGCPGEHRCGSYYLLMNRTGLKQLRYVPFDFERIEHVSAQP